MDLASQRCKGCRRVFVNADKLHGHLARSARCLEASVSGSAGSHSTAGATATAADWLAKLEICEEELASFELDLELYVKHLIRKALSGMIEPTLLRHVRNDKELIHLVIDHSTHSASAALALRSVWLAGPTLALKVQGACPHFKRNFT